LQDPEKLAAVKDEPIFEVAVKTSSVNDCNGNEAVSIDVKHDVESRARHSESPNEDLASSKVHANGSGDKRESSSKDAADVIISDVFEKKPGLLSVLSRDRRVRRRPEASSDEEERDAGRRRSSRKRRSRSRSPSTSSKHKKHHKRRRHHRHRHRHRRERGGDSSEEDEKHEIGNDSGENRRGKSKEDEARSLGTVSSASGESKEGEDVVVESPKNVESGEITSEDEEEGEKIEASSKRARDDERVRSRRKSSKSRRHRYR
jgi:hypothetical protein